MKSAEKDVIVVTGSGRGIGRATAKAFAMNGAAVAIVARSNDDLDATATEINESGGSASPFRVDVRDTISLSNTIERIEESMGPISVFVNNAGVLGPIGWWRAVEVNLRGAAFCMHAVLRKMIARCRGRVINICSALTSK